MSIYFHQKNIFSTQTSSFYAKTQKPPCTPFDQQRGGSPVLLFILSASKIHNTHDSSPYLRQYKSYVARDPPQASNDCRADNRCIFKSAVVRIGVRFRRGMHTLFIFFDL